MCEQGRIYVLDTVSRMRQWLASKRQAVMFYDAIEAYVADLKETGKRWFRDQSFRGKVRAQRRALADMPLEKIAKELAAVVAFWKSKPSAVKCRWQEEYQLRFGRNWLTFSATKEIEAKRLKQETGDQ